MNLVEELKWRGLFHDMMPGTEEFLLENPSAGYIGFDPTADSLHIGHLVQIILLSHLRRAGHTAIAVIGGATGMVGDPSFKKAERNLLDEETLNKNIEGIYSQIDGLLKKAGGKGSYEMVNNYDWMKDFSFLEFIRDVGKHITVNYMLSKDSVKNRMETGISFTEFSYQLLQGYDFLHLYNEKNVRLQMGGSDQWGNIVTGTELIRRSAQGKAYALTTPLITKSDGGKFGKSEDGSVWLDPEQTSPYKFYQWWINTPDEEAADYIKKFTFLEEQEINTLIAQHKEDPGRRILQQRLAQEITTFVHDETAYKTAVEASGILFGKSTKENLLSLSESDILDVLEGVPVHTISKSALEDLNPIDFLSEATGILNSKGEARRALKENSVSVNKEKINESSSISEADLLMDKYIVVQRGKKNYFLVKCE